ncbi:UNVERIFIED_CONTAM: Potassium transporter 10 [Sesamum radiatum]|uniref:Potassium transporter 10 n=1 Tax=Sesamum radiatum TaxID=300843 RepID=A0AAW2PIU7_SESRA
MGFSVCRGPSIVLGDMTSSPPFFFAIKLTIYLEEKETWRHTLFLSLQSLGVIYGRLSTAPLYVLESIDPEDIRSPNEIHELFSFIFWTLTIIPLLKYAFIVLRADDNGEGGPFSLYSLLCRHARVGLLPRNRGSDKILHHEEDNPSKGKLENNARRHHGTKRIGCIFAPIVIIWLFFISGFGLYNIIHCDPQILRAVSPVYFLRFMKKINLSHWKLLSSIVLCTAGSEAMFADLGHFSKKSIKITFICFIYPVLLLTYAGQAAFVSKHFGAADAFHLSESIPNRSQATITAGFSIINQCQALDCFPRVKVVHTSEQIHGQVYVTDVNWLFMTLSLAITIGLHDISQLGKATGLAVTSGMLVTTCLMSLVIALYWEKSLFASVCFLLFFGSIEAIYLSTSLVSFFRGAWCLIILFLLFMTIMGAWHYGTLKKYEFDVENKVSVEWLTDYSPGLGVSRVPGIGFIYSDVDTGIPAFFSHFITNLPAFHQVLIFVSFKSSPVPHIPENRRYLIGRVGPKEYRIYRCIVRYGYCDNVRDTDDFEDQIISLIGEFITREEYDCEALSSPEGKMIILGSPMEDGNALVPVAETSSSTCPPTVIESESQRYLLDIPSDSANPPIPRKRVRFTLPPKSPQMRASVREELEEIIEARESGTAYFLGQSHLLARKGSNFFKKFLIMVYVFLDKKQPGASGGTEHS